MASHVYTAGVKEVGDGTTIDWDADVIKVMLCDSVYVLGVEDHDFVDEAGASDPIDAEISVTGYTGGFGGAGRKSLSGKAVTANKSGGSPANAVIYTATNVTWTALGAGVTIESALIIDERTADTDTRLISALDVSQATNGGDITLDFATSSDIVMQLNITLV